ncbi:PTS sugar transporter subunit IIA [Thalassoroseus pseudoceratinae]|uniref:PTS sugar transporter subunit IIA n=1 Tax=Thalassoroseus pseudoceratinae TaxID=2713176 RepID=UPI00141FF79F|nr:PTS sugar transporter subunit IIA [Thalassoroseus pseudoceratinae]
MTTSNDPYSLDDLSKELGRDRREVEKAASRGRIPGRKVGGEWQFHPSEIRQWLEQAMRAFSDDELIALERSQKSVEINSDLPISKLLTPETIAVPLEGRTKRSILESLVEVAGRTWHVWEPATVLEAVQAREDTLSTAYESGVAVPHPRNPLPHVLGDSVIAFGRTSRGIPFGAPNGSLSDLFFLILCRDTRSHLQVLARLGRMLQQPAFIEGLRTAESADEVYGIICETEEKLT